MTPTATTSESEVSSDAQSVHASLDAFCPMCNDMYESPVKTRCNHTFCQACIAPAITKGADDEGPCPKCKKKVRLGDLTPVGAGAKSEPQPGAGEQRSKHSQHIGYSLEMGPLQHKHREGKYPGGLVPGRVNTRQGGSSSQSAATPGVLMETKLKALVRRLGEIQQKDPSSKSLVFSQFNSSLEWLKHELPKKGFQFRTLTGSMTRKARSDALKAFASDPPTTVFLLSVRSGAVGINLTQANNVFLLEPV
ncbi:unnamed protein product, partial [Sphacelaria rigidula]